VGQVLPADDPAMDPAKALPIQRMNELLDPGYVEAETGYCTMPDGSGYMALLMPMPGGIEYRTRLWMGYAIIDKKPVLMLPPGARIPEEVVLGSLEHDVLEYANFRAVVPNIYAEFGHAIS